jgi:branched-chain amino acid aminotransferase
MTMHVDTLSSAAADAPPFLWRNGQLVPWQEATVHVNAVGHASVAAVFEGIKAYWSEARGELFLFRLREHIARFVDSVRMVRLDLDHDCAALERAVLSLLRANKTRCDTYLRPWCFAKGIVRQLLVPENAATEVIIDSWPFQSALGQNRGCRACVSSWTRIDDRIMPPRVKAFSNYHNSRLAGMEARRNGYDSPILLDGRGKVSEGPASCIAMVRNGRLITPPVTSSILESVTRDTMLRLAAQDLGVQVVEREIDRSELWLAEELFFMGTGWEILPILEVDGLAIGRGQLGPVTRELDKRYTDLVRGRSPDRNGWLTSVYAPTTEEAEHSLTKQP